jgi:hypothetical protein
MAEGPKYGPDKQCTGMRIFKTDHFTDASQRSSSRLHHHLALPFTESIGELCLEVFGDKIVEPWLSTKFIHSLGDFVTCSIPKSGE